MNNFSLPRLCLARYAICISALAFVSSAFSQGSLTPPPGPPGKTMKSLDQIDTHVTQAGEKRIPIDAVHTRGDATNQFIIDGTGSYYLTGDIIGVSGKNGIAIKQDDVTLDLNGFRLLGPPGSLNGIDVPFTRSNLRIYNGIVQGFGGTGINAKASNSEFDHLRVSLNATGFNCGAENVLSDITAGNNSIGISTGPGCTLTRCSAQFNFSGGIFVDTGSSVTNCTADSNGNDGIQSANFCTIKDCTAVGNLFSGIESGFANTIIGCTASTNAFNGIKAGDDSTVSNCTTRENKGDGIHASANCHISDCTADVNGSGGTGSGIFTGIRASISGCSAIGNKGDGIVFSGDSFVLNNHASTNGSAGFHDLGGFSRIDGNVSRENGDIGISAAPQDTVVRNNSGANGNLAADKQYGPTPGVNWGPVETANTSSSPWANF